MGRAWVGGDLDDDSSYELKEWDVGEVIAEGMIRDPRYGRTPVERLEFIVDTIREQLGRQRCQVHTDERDDLELLFGRPLAWCPACGIRLSTVAKSMPSSFIRLDQVLPWFAGVTRIAARWCSAAPANSAR